MIDIRPLANKAEFDEFFKFPWKLYADDPNWVPPLLSMRRQLLDKSKHPAWEYMDGEFFGAWRDGEMVGTIVAFVNHEHNRYHNENIGFFGMFETINDQSVSDGLLQKAIDWAKAQGLDAVRGPASYTVNEECGLLVDNFNMPMVMMPYNPPYYQVLVEAMGFEKVMDVYSMYADRPLMEKHDTLNRLERIVKRTAKRSNITVRNIDMSRKKEEFKTFRDIYNQAWDKNWGFVRMNDKELDALVADLGMLVEPELGFFAEIDGEPVGFALSVPNFNEALHKAYPRPGIPELVTLAQVGWHWKIRKSITSVRMPLMGVKEEYRDRGVDLALLHALLKAMLPSQYQYLDSGWILETNELIKISMSLGNEIYKTHRFYEKSLAD